MEELREEGRRPKTTVYMLAWRDRNGQATSFEARGLDISKSGLGVECLRELKPGLLVYIQAKDSSLEAEAVVVHCTSKGLRYRIGLEFREEASVKFREPAAEPQNPAIAAPEEGEPDYYEIMQISPHAEPETIHRVFRIMAMRFHPDNPETGNVEEFLRLKNAYSVLSDPALRAQYDTILRHKDEAIHPVFELKDFVTGVEAEANRRLGVLSLLYNQRRQDPDKPGISLLDLEKRMGFPREYLGFTTWYLRSKDYITVSDNSDYTLTASGADYVETKATQNEIVTKLIKMGPSRAYPMKEGKTERPPARTALKFITDAVV